MLMQTEFFDFEVIRVIAITQLDDLRTHIALERAETPFLTRLLFQYQDRSDVQILYVRRNTSANRLAPCSLLRHTHHQKNSGLNTCLIFVELR